MKFNAAVATAAFAATSQASLFRPNHATTTAAAVHSTASKAPASASDFADLSSFLANVPTQSVHEASKSASEGIARPTDDKPDDKTDQEAAVAAEQDDLASEADIDKLIAAADQKQAEGILPKLSPERRDDQTAAAAAAAVPAAADAAQATDTAAGNAAGSQISLDQLIAAASSAALAAGAAGPTSIPHGAGAGAADVPASDGSSATAASDTAEPAARDGPAFAGSDTSAPAGSDRPVYPGADVATSAVVPGVASPSNIVYVGNGTANDQQVVLAAAPRTAISGVALVVVVAAFLL
ncbi:hypothetical protein PWT90_08371 [Aphanocladium album]|nr:hypothetical protein PWT90_08371 [Aphanocladium album]